MNKFMTIGQINELNELLQAHSETLTAFYDEAFHYGKIKGVIIGVAGGLATVGICYGIKKIYETYNVK